MNTMKDDAIFFDDDELEAASHWYGGMGSMLYAIASTGALKRGSHRPRNDDGSPMTDDEWLADLAGRLEAEAGFAARDARARAKKVRGKEKKELLAEAEALLGIAAKAAEYSE